LLLLPGVASSVGIGAHMVGEHPALSSTAVRALLMQMMGNGEQ